MVKGVINIKIYKYSLDSNVIDPKVKVECLKCKKKYKGYVSDEYEKVLPHTCENGFEYEIKIEEIDSKVFKVNGCYIDSNFLSYFSVGELDINDVLQKFLDSIKTDIQFEEEQYKIKMKTLKNIENNILNNMK